MAVIKTFTSGTILTLSILLYSDCLKAASLVSNRYDPSTFKESTYNYPNPDMIKALEFIENLRQNSEDTSIPDYDARGAFRPAEEPLFKKLEEGDQENQPWDTIRESPGEGRAEWAKLLLQALMQAESNDRANDNPHLSARYHGQEGFEGNQQDYDGYEFPENDKVSRKQHAAYPEDGSRVNPYKRTNEIVEEEYTPQSLATLESAFRELGKHPGTRKEQGRLEEENFRKEEEDDISRDSDFAYEDVAEGEDWNSVETKDRHQHKEVQFQDEEAEVDRDSERAGTDVKNSLAGFNEVDLDQLDSQEKVTVEKESEDEMPDAAADLMLRYYKRLQGRMEEGQSRGNIGKTGGDRNVGNEKMPSRQSRGSEGEIDPEVVNQLVELSSRLQIPPDDIVKMLKDTEQKKQAEIEADLRNPPAETLETAREDKRFRDSYTRDHNVPDSGAEDLATEDILSILGVDDRLRENPVYFRKDQSKPHLSGIRDPFGRLKGNRNQELFGLGGGIGHGPAHEQGINIDHEELARYLEEMLPKNPDFLNSADIPRARVALSGRQQDPVKELLRGIDPRRATEIMSVINNLPSFAGNAYQAPRREQNGENSSAVMQKLMELVNEQNEERDRSVKELNRRMFGSDV
ncbi:secretogranin-2a [Cetorhinus maximus]